MSKIDSRLVEMFEYNLGIDLREPKHQGFLYELADYFKSVSEKAINEFYDGQLKFEPPTPEPKEAPLNKKGKV